MSLERAIEKYIVTVKSDFFMKYEKEFATTIVDALSNGYNNGYNEPDLVKAIYNEIIANNNLKVKNNVEISTNSVFIHGTGKRSQVEFKRYGKTEPSELGDLIFIISVIYNKVKYFEKITICQFKKDKKIGISWDLSKKEQLYLLSRFPTFKGVQGSIVPMKEFNLPNYSGCLGSYGLLFKPGDFTFVSATELDSFIGAKNHLSQNDLYYLQNIPGYCYNPFLSLFYDPRMVYDFFMHYGYNWLWQRDVFNNYLHAHNVYDFSHKYLTMSIGEPTSLVRASNLQARSFLKDLLFSLEKRTVKKTDDESKRFKEFINDFNKYYYEKPEESNKPNKLTEESDFGEDGDIGIVYTTIDLGE